MTQRGRSQPEAERAPRHMVRLYGISKSRAGRSLWALEEIDLA